MAIKKSYKSILEERETTINDNSKSNIEHREEINANAVNGAEELKRPTLTTKPDQESKTKKTNNTGVRKKHTNLTLRDNRNKIVNTRITAEQYEKIKADAIANDYKSISDYVYYLIKKSL